MIDLVLVLIGVEVGGSLVVGSEKGNILIFKANSKDYLLYDKVVYVWCGVISIEFLNCKLEFYHQCHLCQLKNYLCHIADCF